MKLSAKDINALAKLGATRCFYKQQGTCNNTLCCGFVGKRDDDKPAHFIRCRYTEGDYKCNNPNCVGWGYLWNGQFVHCMVNADVEAYRKVVPRTLGDFVKGAGKGVVINDDTEKTSTSASSNSSTSASNGGGKGVGKGGGDPSYHVRRAPAVSFPLSEPSRNESLKSPDDDLKTVQEQITELREKEQKLLQKAEELKLQQKAVQQNTVESAKNSLRAIKTLDEVEEISKELKELFKIVPDVDREDFLQFLMGGVNDDDDDSH